MEPDTHGLPYQLPIHLYDTALLNAVEYNAQHVRRYKPLLGKARHLRYASFRDYFPIVTGVLYIIPYITAGEIQRQGEGVSVHDDEHEREQNLKAMAEIK